MRVHDKTFQPYISADLLQERVRELAQKVAADLGDIRPIFVGILNGSFMFVSDFLKHYPYACELSFIKLSSYSGMESTDNVRSLIGMDENPEGRTVIILEDIVDTGNTLAEIYRIFEEKKVADLKIATLFYKPESFTKNLKIDYVGFEIPNKFILGYGLDYDGLGRNLPEIYQLKTDSN
jgi:adenylate kinase